MTDTPPDVVKNYIGDTWSWLVTIADPAGIMPNGLTGFTVTALLFSPYIAAPLELTQANNGILIIDPVAKTVLVRVDHTITSSVQIPAGVKPSFTRGPPCDSPSPARIAVIVTDAGGNPTTIGELPIYPIRR